MTKTINTNCYLQFV